MRDLSRCRYFLHKCILIRCACCCIFAVLLSPHINAKDNAKDVLTLQEASVRALRNYPELQTLQSRLRAIDSQRQAAELHPALELNIEVENILGTGDFSGSNAAEYTLSLSSIIELGDKRNSRIAVANSRYALAEIEREAQAMELLGTVTQRFISALAMSEKLHVASEATRLADTFRQAVNQRVERGAAPEVERFRAEALFVQAQLRESAISAEYANRKMALVSLWGAENIEFVLKGDLFSFTAVQSYEELYEQASQNPAIEIFATEMRLREAELQMAHAQSSSNLQWSLGVKQLAESDDTALTAGISLPLFSASRNHSNTQAAVAERESVQYQKQGALMNLRVRLYEAWQTRIQSSNAATRLRVEVIPALEKALQQTQQAYLQGRYRYADMVSVQNELLEARLAMIDAATTAHLNQALIEQLTAVSLSSGNK